MRARVVRTRCMKQCRPCVPNREHALEAFLTTALLTAAAAGALASWAFALHYIPSMSEAFASLVYADTHDAAFPGLRAAKHWSESLAIGAGLVLLAVTAWRRSYVRHGLVSARCFVAFALLAVCMAWSFFGQLLPMDQMAWHGTVVRAGIIGNTPIAGESMRNALFGGADISGTTLGRFSALHTAVLPAVMLALALTLWRIRPRGRVLASGLGALAVGMTLLVAALMAAPLDGLDISARPHEPLADVRPEWFFLPLSMLLRLGESYELAVYVGLALGAVWLLVLPWLRWLTWKNLDRLALTVIGGVLLGLGCVGAGSDAAKREGYFGARKLEDVMIEMGKLNEKFGCETSGDAAARDAADSPDIAALHAAVPDLLVLMRQTREHKHYDDVEDEAAWVRMCDDSSALLLELWRDPGAWLKESKREQLRKLCEDCHKQHDVEDTDVRLTALPPPTTMPPPARTLGLLPPTGADYAGLSASPDMPGRLKTLMKRMNKSWNTLNETDKPDATAARATAQAVLDLEAYSRETVKRWDAEHLGEFGDEQEWRKLCDDLVRQVQAAHNARNAGTWRAAREGIYAACGACHDKFPMDDDVKLTLPR